MSLDERLTPARLAQPEMLLNMGTMNFGIFRCRTATRTGNTTGSQAAGCNAPRAVQEQFEDIG
jgi:hypothetical protein